MYQLARSLISQCTREARARVIASAAATVQSPTRLLPSLWHQTSPCRHFSSSAPSDLDIFSNVTTDRIRNVCIIAHIDHGKTTLADQLLRQGRVLGAAGASAATRTTQDSDTSLDSGDLEKERGITILSKVTSFSYKGHVINLVDTPGHADFGGEVERVIGLVDGAILVVDASEGPLAQTKFVVGKALARGLAPLVLLNKVDKPSATPDQCSLVESALFDLFASLGADDTQLDFPVLYASARQGWASRTLPPQGTLPTPHATMEPLLDSLISHIPPPRDSVNAPFKFSVAMLDPDPYVGRFVTGRIHSGRVREGDTVHILTPPDTHAQHTHNNTPLQATQPSQPYKVARIMKRVGMEDIKLTQAVAGDIVSLGGIPASLLDTVAATGVSECIDPGRRDPPTLRMVFGANDSPFAGRSGKAVTGRAIGERLQALAETSVSLSVTKLQGATERYEVCARGELQLAVILEGMIRDGLEVAVSPPAVLTREEGGVLQEPIEEVTVEVDETLGGQIIDTLSIRKGELVEVRNAPGGRQRMIFHVPSRGLIGYKAVFTDLTRGEGLLSRAFLRYDTHKGTLGSTRKGSMVSTSKGVVTRYALTELAPRGVFFVSPGEEVYEGQVVGEQRSKDDELQINPTRLKPVSNVRSINKEQTVSLIPATQLSLEDAIGYMAGDELLEVTPGGVRLRKVELSSDRRLKMARQAKGKE